MSERRLKAALATLGGTVLAAIVLTAGSDGPVVAIDAVQAGSPSVGTTTLGSIGAATNDGVGTRGYVIGGLAVAVSAMVLLQFRRLLSSRSRADSELNIHLQALDATTMGVVIGELTDDHPVIYANTAFLKMAGFTREDVIGRSLDLLSGSRTQPEVIDEIHDTIAAGESTSVLIANYTSAGVPMWNSVHVSPIRDRGGRVTHYVQAMEDVTDQLKLEQRVRQSEKMDVVGQLAGGIAHDFNNYLTVINAAIDVLRRDPHADLGFWLDQIDEAGIKSAALTSQLMTFSRAKVLDVKTIDLNDIVTDLVPLLSSTIREDISVHVELADGTCPVAGDRSQLDQVVSNIVINARDAMPGGGRITIRTARAHLADDELRDEPHTTGGEYVVLEITDTGTGIDSEIARDIFEPFVTTKDGEFGAGLGLATVYGIVRRAGGLITVDSEAGRGTTFKVHLPLARSAPTTDLAPDTRRHKIVIEGHVLLVEDDETVRTAVRAMLRSLGVDVLESRDGAEALEMLTGRDDIELIVSDVTMPVMGGIELAERAITVRPDIKVLMISGYTHAQLDHRGPTFPLLAKPFTLDELAAKLIDVTTVAGPGARSN